MRACLLPARQGRSRLRHHRGGAENLRDRKRLSTEREKLEKQRAGQAEAAACAPRPRRTNGTRAPGADAGRRLRSPPPPGAVGIRGPLAWRRFRRAPASWRRSNHGATAAGGAGARGGHPAAVEAELKAKERRLSSGLRSAESSESVLAAQFRQKEALLAMETAKQAAELEARASAAEAARQKLEAELNEVRARLLRKPAKGESGASNAAELENLVFGVAHQIRNPLGIIRSLAESRRGRMLASSGERQSLDAILRAITNLSERLEDLVDFSRPLQLSFKKQTPAKLLTELRERVAARCQAQQVSLSAESPEDLPPVNVDKASLLEALLNVAVNALEAMPQGGKLSLSARRDAGRGEIVFTLEDTGPGADPEHLPQSGTPFYTTKPGGVGLGLAAARRILAAHGGTLELSSQKGKGCRVECRLPEAG